MKLYVVSSRRGRCHCICNCALLPFISLVGFVYLWVVVVIVSTLRLEVTSFYGLSSGRGNSLAVLVEVRCSFFSATMAGLAVPPGLSLKLLDDADEKIANSDESVDADGASDADATSVASIGEKSCASYSV